MKNIIEFTNKIENKINKFFTWLNAEPETANEGIAKTVTAFGMFIVLLVAIGLVTKFIGV